MARRIFVRWATASRVSFFASRAFTRYWANEREGPSAAPFEVAGARHAAAGGVGGARETAARFGGGGRQGGERGAAVGGDGAGAGLLEAVAEALRRLGGVPLAGEEEPGVQRGLRIV